MKQKKLILTHGIGLISITSMLVVTFGAAVPAFSNTTLLPLI